jgi:hypothetical protein
MQCCRIFFALPSGIKAIKSGMVAVGWLAATARFYHRAFFAFTRFFRTRARLHFASAFSTSSFETVNILRTALSNRSNSVLPGTCGAGAGFMAHP